MSGKPLVVPEIEALLVERETYRPLGPFLASGSALDLLGESAARGALTVAVARELGLLEDG